MQFANVHLPGSSRHWPSTHRGTVRSGIKQSNMGHFTSAHSSPPRHLSLFLFAVILMASLLHAAQQGRFGSRDATFMQSLSELHDRSLISAGAEFLLYRTIIATIIASSVAEEIAMTFLVLFFFAEDGITSSVIRSLHVCDCSSIHWIKSVTSS